MSDTEQVHDEVQDEVHDEEEEETPPEEEEMPGVKAAGLVRGVPGRHIQAAGLVDLRGVPPEEVAKIEGIQAAGAVLGDEANRAALGQIPIQAAGGVAIARPGYRVIIAPDLEISKAMLEGMPPGQKLMFAGIVFFRLDVPASLVAEKLEGVDVLGILIATEGVYGALMASAEITGHTILLPDGVGPVVRSLGQNTLTQEYLSRLADRTTYINIGQTLVSDEVPEDLLDRKILTYHNVGQTVAPTPLLALLKSRCPTNLGQFAESEGEEA